MSKYTLGLAALAGAVLCTHAESRAALITGVTVEEVSSELSNFGRLAADAVNGNGMGTNVLGQPVHDASPGNMWLTRGNGADQTPADPHVTAQDGQLAHIVFDLGDTYDVSSFRVWNYNEAPNPTVWTTRGAQGVEISVSDSPTGTFTPVLDPTDNNATFTFVPAPGADGDLGQLFTFAEAFSGRYVRFDILTNYGGGNSYTGLSEVRFDDAPIPEPAGIALLALAAGAGLLRRRRRAN
jgi:hypothetical protein